MADLSNEIINLIGTYVHKHKYFLNKDWKNDTRLLNKENYNNFNKKKKKFFKNKSVIIQKFIKNTNFQIPEEIFSMQHFKNKKLKNRMRIYAIRFYIKEYSDDHLFGAKFYGLPTDTRKEIRKEIVRKNDWMYMSLPLKIKIKCTKLNCITKKNKRGNIKEWPFDLADEIYWPRSKRDVLNTLIKYLTVEELGCFGY